MCDSMTPEEMKEHDLKMRAKWAAETILQAEALKEDKELKKYIKSELKSHSKRAEKALGEKVGKKPAPAKTVKKVNKRKQKP